MADKKKSGSIKITMIHSVIGIAIMLLFRFLPVSLPEVTPTGMEILGIFIGTLYLWTTVDPIWSSVLCIAAIGLSSYAPMGTVLSTAFGSPVVAQMLFMMIYTGALVHEKVTLHIGRWFLTRKIAEGRPWLLIYFITLGAYVMTAFMGSPFAPIFLFWPIIYGMFQQVGMTRDDKFAKLSVILVVIGSMCGFGVPPYVSNPMAMLNNYRGIAAAAGSDVVLNDGMYFICYFILGLIAMTAAVLFCRFVLRPDASKLKSITVEDLNKNKLEPLTVRQKVLAYSFVVLILCMLLPCWFPKAPVLSFLGANSMGLALVFVALLCALHIENKPVLDFLPVMEKQVAWPSYFIIVAAILISSVLTAESTGITAFLNHILSPIFSGMNTVTFTIVLMFLMMILTNLCNSFVIGVVLQPVILSFCMANGINAAPIVALSIFFVLSNAMVTPSASPFAALLFGNKDWLDAKDVYKYCGLLALLEFVLVLVIGIPLSNLFMG